MKMSEFRALERNMKILEASRRIDTDEIKGLTIQVIFEQSRAGPNEVPVQMFVPVDHPSYAAVLAVIQAQVSTASADAEAKVQDMKNEFAKAVS